MGNIKRKTFLLSLVLTAVLAITVMSQSAYAWSGYMHNGMASISGQNKNVPSYYMFLYANYAGSPDGFTADNPGWYWHAYCLDSLGIWGAAPTRCEQWANVAKSDFRNGDPANGYLHSSYATHYMGDMSNTMHCTILGAIPSWNGGWTAQHDMYEGYVSGHWDSKFKQVAQNNGGATYYINDVSDSATSMAVYSYYYTSQIMTALQTDPNWQNNAYLNAAANNCVLDGMRYINGLIDYTRYHA